MKKDPNSFSYLGNIWSHSIPRDEYLVECEYQCAIDKCESTLMEHFVNIVFNIRIIKLWTTQIVKLQLQFRVTAIRYYSHVTSGWPNIKMINNCFQETFHSLPVPSADTSRGVHNKCNINNRLALPLC